MRTFELTLTSNAVLYRMYTLMLATSGAVPTDGTLADRGCELTVQAPTGNSGVVKLSDSLGLGGTDLASGGSKTERAARNTICFRDFYLKSTSNGDKVNVSIDYR